MTDPIKIGQRVIVDSLEATCAIVDKMPWLYNTDDGWRWSRYGQIGCVMGIAHLAARLDERWDTGHFQPVGQSPSEVDE